MNEQFTIYCKTCEKDVFLVEDSADDFHCPVCNTYYSSESGVMDLVLAREMQNSYNAAKRGGCICASYDIERGVHRPNCPVDPWIEPRNVDFIRDEERGK